MTTTIQIGSQIATRVRKFASWIDDPTRLVKNWEDARKNSAHDLSEARTYLGLYYSRPNWADLDSSVNDQDYVHFKQLGFNLLLEAVGSVRSQVCKNLEVKLVPVGATFEQAMAAQTFNRILNHLYESENFLDLVCQLFADAAICGRGFGLWEPDFESNLKVYRLDPLSTFYNFDKTEVIFKRIVSRRRALAMFPDNVQDILGAPTVDWFDDYVPRVDSQSNWYDNSQDCIELYYGFAETLGTSQKGCHAIVTRKLAILKGTAAGGEEPAKCEPWDIKMPVFSLAYDTGFREGESRPMGRSMAPYAIESLGFARNLREQLQGSRPTITAPDDIQVELSNANFQRISYPRGVASAGEIQVDVPKTVSADVKTALTEYHDRGLAEHGINAGMAAGEPPPQFKSGLAVQEWRASFLARLSQPLRQVDGCWIGSHRITAQYFPKVYKSKPAVYRAENSRDLASIPMSEIAGALGEDSAKWTFQIVSGLGLTDSGKLEAMGTFQEAGVIDAEEVLDSLASPDLDAIKEEKLGPRHFISYQIDQARNKGKVVQPIDGQDYAKAATRTNNAYAAACAKGDYYPDKNIEALRRLYHLFLDRQKTPAPTGPTPLTPNADAVANANPAPVTAPMVPEGTIAPVPGPPAPVPPPVPPAPAIQ